MALRVAAFRLRGLVACVAMSALAAACGSGYHYAKQHSPTLVYQTATGLAQVEAASTYFKVPPKWTLLDEEDFLEANDVFGGGSPEQVQLARSKQRFQPFDGSPEPSAANVLSPRDHPAGFSQIYVLDDNERDQVSLRELRNLLIRVDPDEEGKTDAEVLIRDDEVVRPGGFHGSRVVFNVPTETGTLLTVDKTTLVDKTSRVVYLFVVACDASCFREHQETIAEVVDSWTIKDT